MPTPSEMLAREAMREISKKHPEIQFVTMMKVMKDATWQFEGNTVTCHVTLPPDIPEKIELTINGPVDDSV